MEDKEKDDEDGKDKDGRQERRVIFDFIKNDFFAIIKMTVFIFFSVFRKSFHFFIVFPNKNRKVRKKIKLKKLYKKIPTHTTLLPNLDIFNRMSVFIYIHVFDLF